MLFNVHRLRSIIKIQINIETLLSRHSLITHIKHKIRTDASSIPRKRKGVKMRRPSVAHTKESISAASMPSAASEFINTKYGFSFIVFNFISDCSLYAGRWVVLVPKCIIAYSRSKFHSLLSFMRTIVCEKAPLLLSFK